MAKYIDAELLRQEIERLKDEYIDIAIDNQRGWVNANFVIDDLEQLQSQINSLQQEPDKNLEEAAEKYRRASCNAAMKPNIDGPIPEYGGNVKDAFIAGALYELRLLKNKYD